MLRDYWKASLRWIRSKWGKVEDGLERFWDDAEPVWDEMSDTLIDVGVDMFKAAIFRAFETVQQSTLSNEEKAIAVKKDMLKTFRYFVDEGKESTLDALQAIFFKVWKRENT